MKFQVIGILIILALLVAGALFYGKQSLTPREPVPGATGENLYASGTYGFSFAYPSSYILSEREVGNAERAHYAITLVHEDDAEPPVNGEGPTSITIDVYDNTQDQMTLEEWLQTSFSNFKLGDGSIASTTVAGESAIAYRWSGLYEGETTAFIHDNSIIAISVTYLSREDQIRADYLALLASLTLR